MENLAYRHPYSGYEKKRDYQVHFKYFPEVYRYFKLENYLENRHVKCKSIDYYKGQIYGTSADEKDIQKLIHQFEASIYSNTLQFQSKKIFTKRDVEEMSKLIFNENGDPKSEFRKFLEKGVKSKRPGLFYLDIFKDNDRTPCCTVYAGSKDSCEKMSYVVEHSIDKHTVEVPHLGKLASFIEKNKQKGNLVVGEFGDKATRTIYCTSDISADFVNFLFEGPSETVQLPDHYSAYIEKYGKYILGNVEEKYKVKTRLDAVKKTLLIEGDFDDISRFKSYFPKLFFNDNFTLVPGIKDIGAQFDRIADKYECTWSCYLSEQQGDSHIEGCKYLSTFHHPAYPGTLSCITGIVSQLKVDALILLVTDMMRPLHEFNDTNSDLVTTASDEPGRIYYRFDVVPKQTLHRQCGWLVQLVTEYANRTSTNIPISSSNVRQLVRTVEDKKCKTVCLPVTRMMGKNSPETIVIEVVNTYITEKWEEKDIQFHLCFEEGFSDFDKIIQNVEEKFKKAGRLFLRRSNEYKGAELGGSSQIKIEAKNQMLQDIQVDAVVNPTRLDLDLSKGYVSKSLALASGEELKTECRSKGPITYDKVLVTSPYKLNERNKSLKYIIHGALPAFEVEKYQKDVKKFVKLCLIKAEEEDCRSIAFPVVGTGNHGNPKRETVKMMFDAINEYSRESFDTKIKTVVFALTDEDSEKVFANEERMRARTFAPYHIDIECVEGTVRKGKNAVTILFGERFDDLPTYVVDVKFSPILSESWVFKYSSDQPFSKHDSLSVKLDIKNDDTDGVRMATRSCLAYCKSNRITEIKLDKIPATTLTTRRYYEVLTNTVVDFVSDLKTKTLFSSPGVEHGYVNKIYIELSSDEMAEIDRHFLKAKIGSSFSGITSFLAAPLFVWKKNITTKQVCVQIIGKSPASVRQVKKEMHAVIASTDSPKEHFETNSSLAILPETGAIPKYARVGNDDDKLGETRSRFEDKKERLQEYVIEKGMENRPFNVSVQITAEINPGFIDFKTKFQDLERWTMRVKTVFSLRIEQSKNKYTVHGTFDQIMLFKYYLDHCFPKDPAVLRTEKVNEELSGIFNKHRPLRLSHAATEDRLSGKHEGMKTHSTTGDHLSISNDVSKTFFLHMKEEEAKALLKLYPKTDIPGLRDWIYNSDRRGLVVSCLSEHVKNLQNELPRKMNTLHQTTMSFAEKPKEFMVAESKVTDMNADPNFDAYFGVSLADHEINIFGKDKVVVDIAKEKLKSMVVEKSTQENSSEIREKDLDAFYLKEKAVKVYIYVEDLKKLVVKSVAVPAHQSPKKIQGIQSIILQEAGREVIEEYEKLFISKMTLAPGELKKTSAGRLSYNFLFHIYLPKIRNERETNMSNNDLLENAVLSCLKTADENGCSSIGLPFIGSGKTGYSLDICAQQYFRACTNKEWVPENVREIHFVSNIEDQVIQVRGLFRECMKNYTDGRGDGEDQQDIFNKCIGIGKRGNIKLYVAEGCVTKATVDAIACHQNKYFTSSHGVCGRIFQLCGMKTKERLKSECGINREEGLVYPVSLSGEDELTCKSVLYVSFHDHRSSHTNEKLKVEKLSELIVATSSSILKTATEMGYRAVAIPLLGKEDYDSSAVKKTRCRAMMKGIFDYSDNNDTTIQEIHVLDEDPFILEYLRQCTKGIDDCTRM